MSSGGKDRLIYLVFPSFHKRLFFAEVFPNKSEKPILGSHRDGSNKDAINGKIKWAIILVG